MSILNFFPLRGIWWDLFYIMKSWMTLKFYWLAQWPRPSLSRVAFAIKSVFYILPYKPWIPIQIHTKTGVILDQIFICDDWIGCFGWITLYIIGVTILIRMTLLIEGKSKRISGSPKLSRRQFCLFVVSFSCFHLRKFVKKSTLSWSLSSVWSLYNNLLRINRLPVSQSVNTRPIQHIKNMM